MLELFGAVRQTSTVALSGEAADGVFGGYPWFFHDEAVWADTFPWLGDAVRLTDFLAPDVRSRIKPRDQEQDLYRSLLAGMSGLPGETGLTARMREALYLSMQGPLAVLLDRKDRMSMAVGLEVRVPFCDHRLVEYAWNVPWELKCLGGEPKGLLRAALSDRLPTRLVRRPESMVPVAVDPRHRHALDTRVRPLPGARYGGSCRPGSPVP